jgi:hypothetical protein
MIARKKAKEAKKALEAAGAVGDADAVPAGANGRAQDAAPVSRQRVQPVRTTRSKRKK